MTFRGLVKNGVVVPEAGATLPEGAEVRIDIATTQEPAAGSVVTEESGDGAPTTFYERYKSIIGVINDLPADASERVDDYLYGPPKS